MWESVKYEVHKGVLCCFMVIHESITLLQTLAESRFKLKPKEVRSGLKGVALLCALPIPVSMAVTPAVLSEQAAAGEALQRHELPGLPGGECRARLPALPALVWPLHGKGGAANCRWKHGGPRLGTFFRDSAQSNRTGTSPDKPRTLSTKWRKCMKG